MRVQGFVAAATGTGPYGVDLLANFRSQPNANYQNATVTRIRGFLYPDVGEGTPGIQMYNAGIKIDDWDEDPGNVQNVPINGPDEDWLAWFPMLHDFTLPSQEFANWNEGRGWAVDVKSQRIVKQRQQTLWLFCDPPGAGSINYNYNFSIGMKLH